MTTSEATAVETRTSPPTEAPERRRDPPPETAEDRPLRVDRFSGPSAEWDDFVRGQRGWTHFHLHGWKRVIDDVHGHDCPYLAARDHEDRLAGVLPLARIRSPVFGHFLVSMPFVNYGGPLGGTEAARALADVARRMARSEGADLLELRSRVELPLSLPASHRRIGVLLDLPGSGDPDDLWEAFDGSVRNQVRKPKKQGIEVRFGADQIDPFFHVFSRHMRDLGTPTQPRGLFAAIRETFGDDAWFGCAYLDDRPIACGCGLRWADEFEMTWASALFDFRSTSANMLLYWRFMERAIEEGLSTFNFGRCRPGSGTHRFKKQWGTRDETLWWYQRRDGTDATPAPEDDAYDWGPEVWRRLPLPVATTLGPRIVRYIP